MKPLLLSVILLGPYAATRVSAQTALPDLSILPCAGLLRCAVTPPSLSIPKDSHRPALSLAPSSLPLVFEPNHGQANPEVRYLSRAHGYTLFLTDREAVMALGDSAPIHMRLAGASVSHPEATEPTGGISNYFHGKDPANWVTKVPHYRRIRYRNVYAGIDEVFYGDNGKLEYDLVVAPGADPNMITMEYGGADAIRLDATGGLLLTTSGGDVHMARPSVYQLGPHGDREEIAATFRLAGPRRAAFTLARYDRKRPLIIDPTVGYASYLGGTGYDAAYGVAVDGDGSAYVTGITISRDFPTVKPFQPTANGTAQGFFDMFVSKVNPAGTALLYSTYLGGTDDDRAAAIAVDKTGNAYVTGRTHSQDFPVQNALQSRIKGTESSPFVVKLDQTGAKLVYSTYLGGTPTGLFQDAGNSIAADADGNAYIVGATSTRDFPTLNPIRPDYKSSGAFISKLSAQGSLVYSSYLGGEQGTGVAVDATGAAYVTGFAYVFSDFQTKNAYQPKAAGYENAFVAKINPAGSAFVWATFLGGKTTDEGRSIAVDADGNTYVAGLTNSPDFPTKNSMYTGGNGFLTKIAPDGASLVYSTYLWSLIAGVAVDAAQNVYIGGFTNIPIPLKEAIQPTPVSNTGFVAALSRDAKSFLYSTFVGGSNFARGIAADAAGNAYLVGEISGGLLPPYPAAFQPQFKGGDAYLVKLVPSKPTISTVSAASFKPGAPITPNSIATAFGDHLAIQTATASGTLGTTLGGTTINITDAALRTVAGSLFYVGPGQVNFLVPPTVVPGPGQVQITAGDGTVSVGPIQIADVSPGIFTADGTLAVGQALQIDAQGNSTTQDLLRYDTSSGKFIAVPVKLGPSTSSTYLILYGTGIRLAQSAQISVNIGGLAVAPAFAGIQGAFAGLDQVNILIPRSLAGAGDVAITLTAAGQASNTVHVAIQ